MAGSFILLSGELEDISFARENSAGTVCYASDASMLARLCAKCAGGTLLVRSGSLDRDARAFLGQSGRPYAVFHTREELSGLLKEPYRGEYNPADSHPWPDSAPRGDDAPSFSELSPTFSSLAGNSPAMRQLRRTILKVASCDVSVLILGETGTGKTTVARAIHELSPRRKKIFKEVVISTMNEGLVESKLFGVAEGGFTGAVAGKGVFEEADGGTLFFDEIGEISPAIQTKFLQVLGGGVINRIGSNKDIRVDNRMIFATNADLDAKIRLREFREDLFYRINDVTLRIPPLRERLEDIPALCAEFLRREKISKTVSPAALAALQAVSWRGNVRQLEKCVRNAALLYCDGDVIEVRHVRV